MSEDVQKRLDDQREIWKQQQKTNKTQKEKKRKRQGETKEKEEEEKESKTNNENKKKKQKQTKKETEKDKDKEENNTIQVLLAKTFDSTKVDPIGYWMSEKMDGVRAFWNGSEFVSRLGNRFHVRFRCCYHVAEPLVNLLNHFQGK